MIHRPDRLCKLAADEAPRMPSRFKRGVAQRAPVHFGFRGDPDAWAPTYPLSWFGLVAVSCVLSWFIHALTVRGPLELWNIPQQQRFLRLSPERASAPSWRVCALSAPWRRLPPQSR